jgi:hypothetical protein
LEALKKYLVDVEIKVAGRVIFSSSAMGRTTSL